MWKSRKRYVQTLEDLFYIVKLLNARPHNKVLIIVEGKSDKAMLEKLPLSKNIHILTLNNPTFKKFKFDEYDCILILTDFDREGEKLYKEILRYIRNTLAPKLSFLDMERDLLRKYFTKYGYTVHGAINNMLKFLESSPKNLLHIDVHTSFHKKKIE